MNRNALLAVWAKHWQILQNELWFSPVSVAELLVLLRKGRLTVPGDVAAWVAKTIEDLQLTEAPLTVEVALAISAINFPHGDPADHFLAASAKVFDLTLDHCRRAPDTPAGNYVLANH